MIATRDGTKGQEVADAAADLPGDVLVIPTDVTQPDAVEAMVAGTVERFGPVDILVNNAGGVFYPKAFLEKTREEAEWEVNLNVWGVWNCTRAVGASMVERKTGSIVNITSNSALEPEAANMVATYGGTKGFVMAFSKGLAYEWGPEGVRINCISPGWIVPHEADHVGEGSFWKQVRLRRSSARPEQMAEAAASGRSELQRRRPADPTDRSARGHRRPRPLLRLRTRRPPHGTARERERRFVHALKGRALCPIWQPGPRPEWVQALHQTTKPEWIELDADRLLAEEAQRDAGLDDFGDDLFWEPFRTPRRRR